MTNTIMARTGSPAHTWFLAMQYVCFIQNHLAHKTLSYRTPLEKLTGITPDISPLLRFRWYEPVYYPTDDASFPSDPVEQRGRFVGIAENVGHAMTFKILTDDTQRVIARSNIRTAVTTDAPNLRADSPEGEISTDITKDAPSDAPSFVTSRNDPRDGSESSTLMTITPEDIVGRTFLTAPDEDGHRYRARILEAIDNYQQTLDRDPKLIRFRCSINNDQFHDTFTYGQIIDHLEKDQETENVWKFKRISAHEGPLAPNHPNYKGSKYNVMVEWENGEVTTEPLQLIAADDPVTCAIYAKEKGLLDTPGWKRFGKIAKRQKKLLRLTNQAKLRSFRHAPKYMYGFEVPRDYKHGVRLDERNGNTKWQDCTDLEMTQLDDYDTFISKGKDAPLPKGYKLIRVHLVYAVKHDGRHKARLVADGHLTDVPVESVYSGVVSLRGLRLLVFIAELNGLEVWATDIGNAYLEAYTSEKVAIRAGPEFGARHGHLLLISKALYGLRTSGLRWHERLAEVLGSEGFLPCKMEPDIWIRRKDDIYEYVAVYVDDLAFAVKDPQALIDTLTQKYKFKLKGTGAISFHLGCDFGRDDDGTLYMAPNKYIEKISTGYKLMFGRSPSTRYMSPLEKGDNPELDTTPLLDAEGIRRFQSLLGSLQWAVSLGRFDIAPAVMTMSAYRSAPREGHLQRAQRIVGYLVKMKNAAIRFRTDIPLLDDLHIPTYSWENSVYGSTSEVIPDNIPEPLGKPVRLMHFVDANLYHDKITGRSVSGILHLVNQTPIDWYSKKQSTVETATYGSEFVAARIATDQIIDLRNTLRYLGVPVQGPSLMFGDNESVVNSGAQPDAKLHKRHNALSFHRVREAIAAGIVRFIHIPGHINPADILTKHWAHSHVWYSLRPLLFWRGDTMDGLVA